MAKKEHEFKVGLTIADAQKSVKQMDGVIARVNTLTSELKKAAKGGKVDIDVKAGIASLKAMEAGANEYLEAVTKMAASGKTTDKAFDVIAKSAAEYSESLAKVKIAAAGLETATGTDLNAALEAYDKSLKKAAKDTSKFKDHIDGLGDAVGQVRGFGKGMWDQIKSGDPVSAFFNTRKSANDLSKSFKDDLLPEMAKIGGGAGKAESGVASLGEGAAAGGEGIAGMVGTVGELAASLAPLLALFAGVAAGVALFLKGEAKIKAMNKEILKSVSANDLLGDAFSKAGSSASGAYVSLPDKLSDIRKEIFKVSFSVGGLSIDMKDAQDAVQGFAKAGAYLPTYQRQMGGLTKIMETSVIYSRIWGTSIDDVSAMMGDWTSNLGMSLDSVRDGFSRISHEAAATGTNTQHYISVVKTLTSSLRQTGASVQDVTTLVAAFRKTGLSIKGVSSVVGDLVTTFNDMSFEAETKMAALESAAGTQAEAHTEGINKLMESVKSQAQGIEGYEKLQNFNLEQMMDIARSPEALGKIKTAAGPGKGDEIVRALSDLQEKVRLDPSSIEDLSDSIEAQPISTKLNSTIKSLHGPFEDGFASLGKLSHFQLQALQKHTGLQSKTLREMRRSVKKMMAEDPTLTPDQINQKLTEEFGKQIEADRARGTDVLSATQSINDLLSKKLSEVIYWLSDVAEWVVRIASSKIFGGKSEEQKLYERQKQAFEDARPELKGKLGAFKGQTFEAALKDAIPEQEFTSLNKASDALKDFDPSKLMSASEDELEGMAKQLGVSSDELKEIRSSMEAAQQKAMRTATGAGNIAKGMLRTIPGAGLLIDDPMEGLPEQVAANASAALQNGLAIAYKQQGKASAAKATGTGKKASPVEVERERQRMLGQVSNQEDIAVDTLDAISATTAVTKEVAPPPAPPAPWAPATAPAPAAMTTAPAASPPTGTLGSVSTVVPAPASTMGMGGGMSSTSTANTSNSVSVVINVPSGNPEDIARVVRRVLYEEGLTRMG